MNIVKDAGICAKVCPYDAIVMVNEEEEIYDDKA